MTPRDYDCSHSDPKPGSTNPEADFILCGAGPGDYCMFMDSSSDRHPSEDFHEERWSAWRTMNENQDQGNSVSKEDFTKALEQDGRV